MISFSSPISAQFWDDVSVQKLWWAWIPPWWKPFHYHPYHRDQPIVSSLASACGVRAPLRQHLLASPASSPCGPTSARGSHLQTLEPSWHPLTHACPLPFPLPAISSVTWLLPTHSSSPDSPGRTRVEVFCAVSTLCPSPSHTGVRRSGYALVSPTGLRTP